MTEKQTIQTGLAPLFEQARRDGLWFHSSYQDLWFSPDELERAQSNGFFIWGAVNWTLRAPSVRRRQLTEAVESARAALEQFDAKVSAA